MLNHINHFKAPEQHTNQDNTKSTIDNNIWMKPKKPTISSNIIPTKKTICNSFQTLTNSNNTNTKEKMTTMLQYMIAMITIFTINLLILQSYNYYPKYNKNWLTFTQLRMTMMILLFFLQNILKITMLIIMRKTNTTIISNSSRIRLT